MSLIPQIVMSWLELRIQEARDGVAVYASQLEDGSEDEVTVKAWERGLVASEAEVRALQEVEQMLRGLQP